MFGLLFATFAWCLIDGGESISSQFHEKETAALSETEARLWFCLRQYVEGEMESGRNSPLWSRFADKQCIAIVAPQPIFTTPKSRGPEIAYSVGALRIPGDLYAFYFPSEGEPAVTRAYSYAFEVELTADPQSAETAKLRNLGPYRYACVLSRVMGAEKIAKDAVASIRGIDNQPRWIVGSQEEAITWLTGADVAARRGQTLDDRELDKPRAAFAVISGESDPLLGMVRTPLEESSKELLQRISSRHLGELASDSSDFWMHLHRYATRQVELTPETLGFWVSLGDPKATMTMRRAPLKLEIDRKNVLKSVMVDYEVAAIVADGQVFLFGYPAGGNYEIDRMFETDYRQVSQGKDSTSRAVLSRLGDLGPHGWFCFFKAVHENKQRPVAKAGWQADGSALILTDQAGMEVATVSVSELELAKRLGEIPNVERRERPRVVEKIRPKPDPPAKTDRKVMLVVDWSEYLANAERQTQLIREIDHAITSLPANRQSQVSVSLATDRGLSPWPQDAIRAGRLPTDPPVPHSAKTLESLKQTVEALANNNVGRSIVFIVWNVEATTTAPSSTEIAAIQSAIDATIRISSSQSRPWMQVIQLGPGRADWLLRLAQSRNYNTVQFRIKSKPSLLIPDSAFAQ